MIIHFLPTCKDSARRRQYKTKNHFFVFIVEPPPIFAFGRVVQGEDNTKQKTIFLFLLLSRRLSSPAGQSSARRAKSNSDGIHAQQIVQAYAKKLLFVRMVFGNFTFNKKKTVK
ncbi:MAG: hypothetical protein IKQ77_02485 [Prevotella sp.]|nr:hypothetical protein [Prevotella sp.]